MENKLKRLGIIGAVGAASTEVAASLVDNVNHQYELSDALGFGGVGLAFLAVVLYTAGMFAGKSAKSAAV